MAPIFKSALKSKIIPPTITKYLIIKKKPFIISNSYIFAISIVLILYFKQKISFKIIYFPKFFLNQDVQYSQQPYFQPFLGNSLLYGLFINNYNK